MVDKKTAEGRKYDRVIVANGTANALDLPGDVSLRNLNTLP